MTGRRSGDVGDALVEQLRGVVTKRCVRRWSDLRDLDGDLGTGVFRSVFNDCGDAGELGVDMFLGIEAP